MRGPGRRAVFDDDHEALRASVARFLGTGAGERPDVFAVAAAHGFVGLAEVTDPRFRAVVLEEAMAAGLPALALSLAMHDGFALPLLAGRDAPALAAVVDPISSTVVAEPRSGGWTLRGSAELVVNGLGADVLVVGARTEEGSELLLAVDGSAPGLHRTPAEDLLGFEGADVADLRFDGVAVPAADGLGTDLGQARAGHQMALAVAAVAGARTALAITVDYVRVRKAFGKPIATFENTRHALGHLGARVAAVEAFVDSALARPEPDPSTGAAAKLCATDLLGEAADLGVQLHGGYGYMWEYPIARAYAAARFFRLHGGAGAHLDSLLADAIGLEVWITLTKA